MKTVYFMLSFTPDNLKKLQRFAKQADASLGKHVIIQKFYSQQKLLL